LHWEEVLKRLLEIQLILLLAYFYKLIVKIISFV
jgi:hypothetical protein